MAGGAMLKAPLVGVVCTVIGANWIVGAQAAYFECLPQMIPEPSTGLDKAT